MPDLQDNDTLSLNLRPAGHAAQRHCDAAQRHCDAAVDVAISAVVAQTGDVATNGDTHPTDL